MKSTPTTSEYMVASDAATRGDRAFDASHDEDSSPTDDQPVRFEDLVERCMGNIELATRLLDQSQTQLVADLNDLRQCRKTREPDEVARLAHRLKGATANLGAYELSDVFARIEEDRRVDASASVPNLLHDLEQEWTRFTDCVADLCSHD